MQYDYDFEFPILAEDFAYNEKDVPDVEQPESRILSGGSNHNRHIVHKKPVSSTFRQPL